MSMLYFVRHGQTYWNVEAKVCGRTDSALTPTGLAQAQETGRVIKARIDAGEMHIDAILASPLSRAHNTAQAIAEMTGIPVRIEPAIIEQDFGQWEGENKDSAAFKATKGEFLDSRGGGESNARVAQRVYNLLDELRLETDKTYLLAAHNGIARIVYSYFHDMTNEEFMTFQLDNAQVLEFEFDL